MSDGDNDRKLEKVHKIAVMGKIDPFLIRRTAAVQEITTEKNTIMMYGTDDRKRLNIVRDSLFSKKSAIFNKFSRLQKSWQVIYPQHLSRISMVCQQQLRKFQRQLRAFGKVV